MHRREFVFGTGALITAAVPSLGAWLGAPVGQWDGPVLFEAFSAWAPATGLTILRSVGWRAERHGIPFGERMPLPEPYTLNDIAAAITMLQKRADEVLAGLIEAQR